MININTYFDKIYIINLNHRSDRWKNILDMLKKNNIKNYERFPGIIPSYNFLINSKIWKNCFTKFNIKKIKKIGKNYIVGSMGKKISHYNVIKLAKQNNYKKILILEDDIELINNYIFYLNNIINQLNDKNIQYDFISFYNIKNINNENIISENIYISNKITNTCAYSISENIYDIIIENILNNEYELENIYNIIFKNKYNSFPNIINLIESYSDIKKKT
jgi:GR25 family glycosyltransferase involved in LPS biosynthesis